MMPGSDISSAELRQQVLKLALPAASEQVLSVLVNMVNTALGGHLGASALTAVGLSGTITALASVFFGAVSTGGTALIAQAIGAKKPALANRVLGQALMVVAALGLLGASVLLPFARQSLILMGAQGESVAMGVRYITCLALAVPFTALLMVGNAALRGSGDTRTPMTIMGAINLVNLALSYLLIRGVGPLPELASRARGSPPPRPTSRRAGRADDSMRGRGVLRLARLVTRPDRAILAQLCASACPPAARPADAVRVHAFPLDLIVGTALTRLHRGQRIESFSTMPAFGFAAAATTSAARRWARATATRPAQRARGGQDRC
jgi:Na+-driven multidrug efflux pump